MTDAQQSYYNLARSGGAKSWGKSSYERNYQKQGAGKGGYREQLRREYRRGQLSLRQLQAGVHAVDFPKTVPSVVPVVKAPPPTILSWQDYWKKHGGLSLTSPQQKELWGKFATVTGRKTALSETEILRGALGMEATRGMSLRAMRQAAAAGGIEEWRKALAEKAPVPRVRVPTITPDVTVAEGNFEVVAGQTIRDKTTGKTIGYIGANNQLMDIHGVVIGSYVGNRKDVTSVSLATFEAVPEREGIPYCEAKNYEKAKEYLIKLMEAGEIPGGSTLIQRHNEWYYIVPNPEHETMKLDTGEWIYKQEYDKLPTNVQDYLHKFGIKEFIDKYIPAQEYVAAETKKQLKPYEIRGTVPPEGIVNPEFVKYIKSLKGYDWMAALEGGVSPRIIKQFFEELPPGIANPYFVKHMREVAYIDAIVAAIQSGIALDKLKEVFGAKKLAKAQGQIKAIPAWETVEQSKPMSAFRGKYPEYWNEVEAKGGNFWIGTGGKIYFDFFVDGKRVKGAIPEGKIQKDIREAMLEQGYKIPTIQEFNNLEYDVDKWGWSLPAGHPIKSARIGLIITEAAIIGTAAIPAIWAGVGAAGRALTWARLAGVGIGRARLGIVPQIATMLAQFTAVTTPIAITGATITESLRATDLDYKWEAFQALPADKRDYWTRQVGYDKKFSSLTEAEQANVLLHYAVPPGYTLAQWSQTLAEYDEKLVEYSYKGLSWLREKLPQETAGDMTVMAGGAMVGLARGIGFMGQLPLIAGQLTYEIPKGTAKEFAYLALGGMIAFFTTEIPKMIKKDPIYGTGQLIGIFLLSPGGFLKIIRGLGVKPHPRYVPERGMAVEPNSVRIGLADKSVAEWYLGWQRLTKAQKLNVEKQIVTALARSGKNKIKVKIYGTHYSAEVLNVPYQRIVKNTLWAATTDITKFGDVVKIGKLHLFTSPELAIRFMLSTSKGKLGKYPGLLEIHTSIVDRAFKLLRKGEAELEVPIQYKTLDAVKGLQGKGISSNAYVGPYSIKRYTIRGEGHLAWKGPTGKQLAEVRILTAKEATIDALVGWHHRWKTARTLLAKDPRIKKAEASIKQVKSEQPELTKILANGEHQILRQRHAIPHPTSGMVKPRVKGIITRGDGRIMLVKDRAGKAYELPGGSVDVKDIILRGKFAKNPEKVTWEQALASQVMGETMVKLKGIKYLDLYIGKVNEHGLSGARIFEATAVGKADRMTAWKRYQRNKYGYKEPELADIQWWKPGDKGISVLPSVVDILKYRWAIQELLQLQMYKGSKTLLKARDIELGGFADRVKRGKPVSEADIAKMNKAELKALQAQLNELLKGESFTIKEFFTNSEDIALLLEIIKGRRNAIKYIRDSKITTTELKLLREHPELLSQKGWKLINEVQKTGRKLTTKESNFLAKDLEKAFNDIMKWEDNRLGKLKNEYEKSAYLENEGYYNKAYSRYYYALGARPLIAGIGYARYIPYQDEPEIVRHYTSILKRDRLPIPRAVVARVVPPRKEPRKGIIPVVKPGPRLIRERIVIKKEKIIPVPRKLLPKDTIARLTKKQREGIIAWKQGWVYKLIYPPYGVKDIINSRKPLSDVKYYSGAGAAYKSVIAKGGKVPPEVLRDMGIMDLRFRSDRPTTRKPKLFYKRDIKQRTKTTPTTPGITKMK